MDHPLFIVLNGFDLGRKKREFFSYPRAVLPLLCQCNTTSATALMDSQFGSSEIGSFTKSSAALPLSPYLRFDSDPWLYLMN